MRSNITFERRLIGSGLAASVLLLASAGAFAVQTPVYLTAGESTTTPPDGLPVPMWGYSCAAAGTAAATVDTSTGMVTSIDFTPGVQPYTAAPTVRISGGGGAGASATATLNSDGTLSFLVTSGGAGYASAPNVSLIGGLPCTSLGGSGTWSPPLITVATGNDLVVYLTNNLSFTPTGTTTANTVPTSLVIVGQLGGGLGNSATSTPSPDHTNAQVTTWPIADPTTPNPVPPQGSRVQSFSTEVQAATTASSTATPCPATNCSALTWTAPRAGTYLLESGTHPSIQVPMGLYGILVVTSAPSLDASGNPVAGAAYPGVSYNADVPLLLSEIDPVQNQSVRDAVYTTGFSETMVWSGQPGGCGNPSSATYRQCYPPAVNYTPLYYLVNGVAFDKKSAGASKFPTSPATNVTGNVLVRFVNAGLRMHVPSIVGSQTTLIGGAGGAAGAIFNGFSIVAEDGNVAPGAPLVQSEVFMAAGKTYDVMVNGPSCTPVPPVTTCSPPPLTLPVFDRELSLSANAIARDSGMLAYVSVNGGDLPNAAVFAAGAIANHDNYSAVIAGKTLTVSDPSKGVIANDINIYTVRATISPTKGTLALNADGTFTYVPGAGWTAPDSFTYCGNGATAGSACTDVTLSGAVLEAATGITVNNDSYPSNSTPLNALSLSIKPPGILANDVDAAGYPLTVALSPPNAPVPSAGLTLSVDANGGFNASVAVGGTYTFTYKAQNSQGTVSSGTATVTLTFPAATGLTVTVVDGSTKQPLPNQDYRWVIEEDRTFYVDPKCTKNPLPAGCPVATPQGAPAVFGTNFHTSNMPLVATGCTGPRSCESGQTLLGQPAVCDVGNGVCRTTAAQETPVLPSQVHLDPNKRYYISVLPGDAANPFIADGYAGPPTCDPSKPNFDPTSCGHGMGGAPVRATCSPAPCTPVFAPVTVLTQPSPYPPAKMTIFVFEDDWPLNGEHDASGGVDVLATHEPGLGSFQITVFDQAGGTGDTTGTPTYDMFNMPLTNSLAGTIDPATGFDACPISPQVTDNTADVQHGGSQPVGPNATADQCANDPTLKGCQKGIIGMIVTCPTYESDGVTLSPLAGHAVISNLYQGRYDVMATPGADRIARGEEWLQTNTLDGEKAHEAFMRIGEPAYFQEYGPAGYHVSIGFANPKIIRDRAPGFCAALDAGDPPNAPHCTNEVKGHVTTARMSRVPDERLYGSGSRDSFSFTQCYASLGDPEGQDFAFSKCDDQGNFDFTGIPAGPWKVTIFDQWNDQIVDGIMTAVAVNGSGSTTDMGEIAVHQWHTNIYTRTFFDANGNGVSDKTPIVNGVGGDDLETGLALASTNIRFRDGSFSNFNNTDLNGYAGFNEIFPLFNWYVIETTNTRFKTTGVHVVYDTGGPADGSSPGGTACAGSTSAQCGSSNIAQYYANTYEANPLPASLSVPGAVYCPDADCGGYTGRTANTTTGPSIRNGPTPSSPTNHSSGRIDPPFWFGSYGWQGFIGQNSFLEFGEKPFAEHENGGIHGHVVYASTRPFDDPQLLLQLSWEPLVPHVRVNLYKEGFAPDNVTPTLTLVDFTDTTSFDDWAQGFHLGLDASGRKPGDAGYVATPVPNMNCPGQSNTDPFFFTLQNQPQWLNFYNSLNGGPAVTPLPFNSQYKCYDGMHNWNQLQPAPYDGMYSFPSVNYLDPVTGRPLALGALDPTGKPGSNCTACIANPDATDPYRSGTPMLPAGKYVVEIVVPPGLELVKEEDKNILIGDNFIAPAVMQFGGLGSIFIMPDQAEVAAYYNANNPLNPTTTLGVVPRHEGDTGSVESFWPCVGAARIVPDYISLFPQSGENAPFAGAKRNLCDRKEVALTDQASALVKFYVFSSTHIASHYTGIITDDFTSEFDPFSPSFGEKFAPAYLPVSVKDWAGNEVSRVYADQWGTYNGLNYSTWEVNPPNPTGYGPTTMVMCMNDSGTGATPDALFQQGYSQFCYHLPFMPGQTGYFDTPVVPNTAFSEGYNHPDCNYPDATPAIKSVVNTNPERTLAAGKGPWVSAAGRSITITALGDQSVENYGYTGPSQTAAPYNQQKVVRHYGFGTTRGTVTIGGVNVPAGNITTWNDTTIVLNVPGGVPACPLTQQVQYGGSAASCGQLVITNANRKQSVDTINVTIGGKTPTVLAAGQTIQSAIDAALPGDMIIVPPGVYNELVLMWKPIRLQGVGAASSIINGNSHPAGKLDPWRKQVNCLFGLTPDGRPNLSDRSCSSGWNALSLPATTGALAVPFPTMIVDRIPAEGILGWDATVNGNLAEQLLEPGLMGAYEGAAITVLGKGVDIPGPATNDAWGIGAEAFFPDGTVLLDGSTTAINARRGCGPNTATARNRFPSNFYCNPSRIDGLGITNSSQGGGGIFVHAWGHNIQISNNRVYDNTGSLGGGITIGQGEHIDLPLVGEAIVLPPGSCESNIPIPLVNPANLGLPYCYNKNVNIHHNSVTLNSSIGDELFSSTPAGAGGVSIANGSDYYQFTNNWVCGNLSSGDGGGLAHIGWSKQGLIEHNTILFNQSANPTISTNGGGVLVMGAPDPDPPCSVDDQDCVPVPSNSVPPGDGTGLGLVINANLIMGNAAESGSGGGLRLQHVNGNDAINFPNGRLDCLALATCRWNSVNVTNNIIANNVAGWDGAGVSLLDALAVNIVNNTIISNDSTASSGVLFNSLFAPLASGADPNFDPFACHPNDTSHSCPQVAGLVSIKNSPIFQANLPATNCPTNPPFPAGCFSCPVLHGSTLLPANGGAGSTCRQYSIPALFNNIIWENRSFVIGVGGTGPGTQNQQNVVSLLNANLTAAPSQPQVDAFTAHGNGFVVTGGTGACVQSGPNAPTYWDIGVRGDMGPAVANRQANFPLNPMSSWLSPSATGYDASNSSSDPNVLSQYCNGSRVPPELGSMGYQVPPGTNEANVPVPVFMLTPSATVDEGNNWINMRWGPLAQANPVTGATLANYGPSPGSPVIDSVPFPSTANTIAPADDFYGNPRPKNAGNRVDVGAVEFLGGNTPRASVGPSPLAFGNWATGSPSTVLTVTVTNTANATLTTGAFAITSPAAPVPFSRPAGNLGTCGGTAGTSGTLANLAGGASCTINIVFSPTATGNFTGSLAISYQAAAVITGSPVSLLGTGVTMAVNPASLSFTTGAGTTSAVQNLTVRNSTGATRALTVAITAPFARSDGNCGANLNSGATCTIGVVFQPPSGSTGTFNGTATITTDGGVTVGNSPVGLEGVVPAVAGP